MAEEQKTTTSSATNPDDEEEVSLSFLPSPRVEEGSAKSRS